MRIGPIKKSIVCKFDLIYRGNKTLPKCNTTRQIAGYVNATYDLQKLIENGVFNLTGCLSSCKKSEYGIDLEERV